MSIRTKKRKQKIKLPPGWAKMATDKKYDYVKGIFTNLVLTRRKEAQENAGFFDSGSSTARAVYRGARKGKHNEDWQVSSETSDYELSDSLPTLRHRSRQLVKDNGIAEGTVLTYIGMAIGDGPTVTARAKSETARKQIQEVLDKFNASCDLSGEKDIVEQLEELVSSSCTDGDVLVNLPLDTSLPVGEVQTRIQLIEADRIHTPSDKKASEDKVRLGVVFDAHGKVTGYYVRKMGISESEHAYGYTTMVPSSNFTLYNRKSKDGRDITWLYKRPGSIRRPDQSRQVPLFSSCMDLFKDVEDLLDAHVVGARAAACIMAFIKSKNPDELMEALLDDPETGTELEDKFGQKYNKLQPATIIPLKEGEELQSFDPKRDSKAIDEILVRIFKLIAMRTRVPYAILFLDLKEINYSSYRGGMLEARRLFRRFRQSTKKNFLERVYRTIITEAYLKGLLPAVGELTEEVLVPRIDFPAWGYIDLEKESKAEDIILNKTGTSSPQRLAAGRGENALEILEENILYEKAEAELREKHGVKKAAPPPAPPPPGTEEEEEPEEVPKKPSVPEEEEEEEEEDE